MAILSYLEAIREGLRQEMELDRRVCLLGEDIGSLGGAFRATEGLQQLFGVERVLDTPISESAIIGAAIGMAVRGLRPVVELQFMDFLACGLDPLINYAAKSRYLWGVGIPMVVRGPYGAGVRAGPFHSQSPEALLTGVPGLKVVTPATPADASGLLVAAIRDPDPVVFLEHKLLYRSVRGDVPAGGPPLPIGRARLCRTGGDVSVVTYGAALHLALEAATRVERQGIETEVLDLRTLQPLDRAAILQTARHTGRVLIVHEATRTGGPGAEVAALVAEGAFEALDAPIARLTAPDTPVPLAPALEDAFLPSVDGLCDAIRALEAY
jgi:pyruvate/2-oxoglutarate/acetoin dehydrogenase E1 component